MKRALRFGLIAALSSVVPAAPLHASSPAQVNVQYDFYIGGFHIAEVSLSAMADGAGYRARSHLVTRGVLDVVVRGRSASEASGRRGAYGQLMPVDFSTLYSSRTGEQKIQIDYVDANPSRVTLEPKAPDPEKLAKPNEWRGSLDPLSAAVAALVPSRAADLCNRSIPIFDGKRRFDIMFLPVDPRRLKNGAPAPTWNKPMKRCLGIYERVSGFGDDAKENRYFPFDIWFEDSGNGVFRAVRIAGSTKLGFAIGDLRAAR